MDGRLLRGAQESPSLSLVVPRQLFLTRLSSVAGEEVSLGLRLHSPGQSGSEQSEEDEMSAGVGLPAPGGGGIDQFDGMLSYRNAP
jgi:hypothetical protein